MPVSVLRILSLWQSRMEKGVRAYARAPIRSDQPPSPVRVLWRVESAMGVIQVL